MVSLSRVVIRGRRGEVEGAFRIQRDDDMVSLTTTQRQQPAPLPSQKAERPLGSALRDWLCWFAPQTWWGLVQLVGRSPYTEFTVGGFLRHVLGLLLPLLVMGLLQQTLLDGRLLASTMLSPWAFLATQATVADVHQVFTRCKVYADLRKPVLNEARWALQSRCAQGRAFRLPRADVYLPSSPRPTSAMLFYPGALVPHEAYSEIAGTLADACNLVVVVASAEPLRMAEPAMGANRHDATRLMRQVQQRLSTTTPLTWCLGGHSLGSFAAMRLASLLRPTCLVMWASGPYPNERTSLAHTHPDLPVLVVQGSSDQACHFSPDQLEAFFQDLPVHASIRIASGVTHNGFSTYTPNPIYDGTTTLSRHRQHQLVVDKTAPFLKQHMNP